MSQDTYNKFLTTVTMLFFMVMYTISFITGKHLDWMGALAFGVPTINHIAHLLTNIMANRQQQLTTRAEIAKNGTIETKVDIKA